jgi:hypothetical protein
MIVSFVFMVYGRHPFKKLNNEKLCLAVERLLWGVGGIYPVYISSKSCNCVSRAFSALSLWIFSASLSAQGSQRKLFAGMNLLQVVVKHFIGIR